MAADMRFYHDIGFEGVYLQGMGHSGGGGEWSLLRPWYGMKLLWDPDQDADALIDDFLQGYYGDAAEPLKDYIDLLHDEVEQDDVHMHLYSNPAMGYLTDEVVALAQVLFDRAERRVADDPELLERVRVARMPLVYARFFPRNGYAISDGKLVWQGERASYSEIMDFVDRAEAHGFTTVREVSGGMDTMLLLAFMLEGDLRVVSLENPVLEVQVVPMLAGRALRIIYKPTGGEVTAYNRTRALWFPFAGGLEDRIGEMARYYGWVEPATIDAQDALSLTTHSDTYADCRLARTLSLDPTEPILRVTSVVTNTTDGPQVLRLRSHLDLDLGELRTTRVRFTDRAGRQVDEDMTRVIAGERLGVHFYDQDTPAGQWSLVGSKGMVLTQRFDPTEVDFTWLYAFPEDLADLEAEVWSKRVTVEPGESVELHQELEIRPTQ